MDVAVDGFSTSTTGNCLPSYIVKITDYKDGGYKHPYSSIRGNIVFITVYSNHHPQSWLFIRFLMDTVIFTY